MIKNLVFAIFTLSLLSLAVLIPAYGMDSSGDAKNGVRISYFGHACFAIQGLGSGKTILIDPPAKLDYPLPSARPDVVIATHEHADHNNVAAVKGHPAVIRGLIADGKNWNEVEMDLKWARVRGVPAFHDKEEGKKRGKNMIFLIEMEDMRIVHLGDLGQPLTDAQVAKLWPVDVLLAPVGGYYTLEPEEISAVAARLDPKILIPMHYKDEYTPDLPIKPLDVFLKDKKNIKELKGHEYTIFSSTLPKEMKIVVFKVEGKGRSEGKKEDETKELTPNCEETVDSDGNVTWNCSVSKEK